MHCPPAMFAACASAPRARKVVPRVDLSACLRAPRIPMYLVPLHLGQEANTRFLVSHAVFMFFRFKTYELEAIFGLILPRAPKLLPLDIFLSCPNLLRLDIFPHLLVQVKEANTGGGGGASKNNEKEKSPSVCPLLCGPGWFTSRRTEKIRCTAKHTSRLDRRDFHQTK